MLLQRNLSTRYCTLCFLFEIMHKNNDFWLLKHFRHSWNENNFSFASLIFFSVTPSHRSGPNSSWTHVFWNAHWFASWAEFTVQYSLKTWGWYSTCLSDCQIQQCVSPWAALLFFFITMSTIWQRTPAQLLMNLFPASQSDLHCIQCFYQFMHLLRIELMTSVFELHISSNIVKRMTTNVSEMWYKDRKTVILVR